ncbi:MAG: PIG-L family deacetylase, partial [Armatimonadota bacterium]
EFRPRALFERFNIALLATWYTWIGLISAAQPVEGKLAAMPPPRFGERVLVFAPHEDDETLGTAIYARRAIAAGAQVYVCLMTAGEGEELGAALLTKRPPVSPRAFFRLGQARQRETLRAMAQIGLPKSHVIFLDYPNMGLQRLWSAANWSPRSPLVSPYTKVATVSFDGSFRVGAPFCGASVLSDVEAVMEQVQPTQVFTAHPADIHSDHWPTYCFVKLALTELRTRGESSWARPCRLYTYLVHRRGWPSPWGYYPELSLMPPPALVDLPVNRWLGLSLTPDEIATKNRMILTYRSQLARFDMLLRAFSRGTEIYGEVLDVRLMPEDLATQGVFLEPTADSASIRKRPYADLSQVDLWTDGRELEIKIHTLAPQIRNVRMQAIVHLVDPATDSVRVLEVEVRPGTSPQFTGATDTAGVSALTGAGLRARSDGDTAIVRVPYFLLGSGQPVMVDIVTKLNRRTVDHSITRLVYLPAAKDQPAEVAPTSPAGVNTAAPAHVPTTDASTK